MVNKKKDPKEKNKLTATELQLLLIIAEGIKVHNPCLKYKSKDLNSLVECEYVDKGLHEYRLSVKGRRLREEWVYRIFGTATDVDRVVSRAQEAAEAVVAKMPKNKRGVQAFLTTKQKERDHGKYY